MKFAAELRTNLAEDKFMREFKTCYENARPFSCNDVELLDKPFQVCVINNLLENSLLLDDVRGEFNDLEWNKRSMDLYEFFQSADLKHVDSKFIRIVYDFLKTDVRDWVCG